MKLIFLTIGCAVSLSSMAQNAAIRPMSRPASFETVDISTDVTDMPPMKKAVVLTAQITESLEINDSAIFEKLLEVNYEAEYLISKIKIGKKQPLSVTKIEKARDRKMKNILTENQYQFYKQEFSSEKEEFQLEDETRKI